MSVIIEGPLKEVLLAVEATVPEEFTYLRGRIAYAAKVADDYPHLANMQLGVGAVGLREIAVVVEEEE